MSLVGFKAEAHPQQVKAGTVNLSKDERFTPDYIFDPLHEEFSFTVDVAACEESHKVGRFYTKQDDGLTKSWRGERVWLNPPYSDLSSWTKKAFMETREGGCELVVMLIPANRTEQPFWQEFIEPYRDRPTTNIKTRFISKRINFGSPDRPDAKWNSSAPFGCVLVIFYGTNY